MGASGFSLFSIVCRSVVFVEWGGDFLVKAMKTEVLRLGPCVNFKNTMMKKLVSGGEVWAPNITTIIKKPLVFQ